MSGTSRVCACGDCGRTFRALNARRLFAPDCPNRARRQATIAKQIEARYQQARAYRQWRARQEAA